MLNEYARKLAEYIKNLPDFEHYETYDGNYNNIGATVADAVLSRGHNYERQVRPRIKKIKHVYPNAVSTSEVLKIIERIGPSAYLDWADNNNRDCKLFFEILTLFKQHSIESEEDLRRWLSDKENLKIFRSLSGIGPRTIDYFGILLGMNKTAVTTHLSNFLARAGVVPSCYEDTQNIIEKCARLLNKEVVKLDHSIWQYERNLQKEAL